MNSGTSVTTRACQSLVSTAILCAATAAAQLIDDFNDGDDMGWTPYDPIAAAGGGTQNSWSFPSGGYRLQAAATPDPRLGPARVASLRQDVAYSSFYVTTDVVGWDNSLIEAFGIFARVQPMPGPATTDGYIFGYVTGPVPYARIVRVVNEGTQNISGSDPAALTLNPAEDYRMVFSGEGDKLEGRIYRLPDVSTPLVTLTATDSSYASGTAGLVSFSLNSTPAPVDVTFDNYYSLDVVPPRLTLTDRFFGALQISWPAPSTGFKLQCSPVLPARAMDWMDYEGGIVEEGGILYTIVDSSSGNKFYRLVRP